MLELEKINRDKNPIESRLFSQGRGKTEWPRHGLREPRLDAYLGPASVIQRMSREDRPGSFRKLARGPMEPSANGLSWSLIIQGLDSSMHTLGHNSELVGSTKKGAETVPRLALAARRAVLVKCRARGWQTYNMLV